MTSVLAVLGLLVTGLYGSAHAGEPYLPPSAASISTWAALFADQAYETAKWEEATRSPYEVCRPSPGPTVLNAYPRPSDGLYCYYWSLYQHNRAIAWMIANGGYALGTLTCEQIDATWGGRYAEIGLTCVALQRDFGHWSR